MGVLDDVVSFLYDKVTETDHFGESMLVISTSYLEELLHDSEGDISSHDIPERPKPSHELDEKYQMSVQ
jgi:hypothetical protein